MLRSREETEIQPTEAMRARTVGRKRASDDKRSRENVERFLKREVKFSDPPQKMG